MTDADRLGHVINKLQKLEGVDEATFVKINELLDASRPRFGYDGEGLFKVAVFSAREYDKRPLLQSNTANGTRCTFNFLPVELGADTAHICEGYRAICLFVHDRVDAEIARTLAAHGVQLLALRCAGFNNVDLAGCAAAGIDVTRVPAYSPYAVAEHAVALMLALNRKLHRAAERVSQGNFTIDGLQGFDMHGKIVGVVGTGKIGKCLIDIMLGFGCRVLAYDRFVNPEVEGRGGVEYVELDDLLCRSDIISLHVPLLPDTHYLINQSAIEKMKKGVMLINTSRGALIDTRALTVGLKSGKIGAAGLDVYEEEEGVFFEDLSTYERVLTDDVLARLCTFPNVMITAHQAFLTREALQNIADTTLLNILEYESGKRGLELTNFVPYDG